jgi:CRISPR-associated endonuclease Cas1
MQTELTTRPSAAPVRDGIVVLSGYGIRVTVDRRHLAVADGVGRQRRQSRFAKAPSRIRRLVVLGHTGFVTLEALRWLADAKAALIVIDADGAVIAATAPRRINDSRLRRLQSIAVGTPVAASIVRELLGRKLEGQHRVLAAIGALDTAKAGVFAELNDRMASATTVDACLTAEAAAAVLYFEAWRNHVKPQFVKREVDAVPEHWRTFGSRHSLLTREPRTATDPVNALLNYLYALLEAETRVALLTFSLDPGLGFAHVDTNRDSLALDVMEAVRPEVDAWLLEFLATRPFKARDFIEERDGRCRLTSTIAYELAPSISRWRSAVAPIVDRLVDRLNGAERELAERVGVTPRPVRPRLATLSEHRTRARIETAVDHRGKRASEAKPEQRCKNCGEPFRGKRCADCGFAPVAVDDGGADRQRVVMMARQRTNRDWEGQPDDRDFKRDILPGLQGVTLRRIIEATGLSKRFASQIRRGLAVPHKRHWDKLHEVALGLLGT